MIRANINGKDPTVVLFPGLPLGKAFRITPLTWNVTAAAQIELFGCAEQGYIFVIYFALC